MYAALEPLPRRRNGQPVLLPCPWEISRLLVSELSRRGPPPGAAARELAVEDDTGPAADAALFGPGGYVRLMHVMNFDVVVSARNASDQGFGLTTREAASGENFDVSPSSLGQCFTLR